MKISYAASLCMFVAVVINSSLAAAVESPAQGAGPVANGNDKVSRGATPLGYVANSNASEPEVVIIKGKTRHILVERLGTYKIVDGSSTLLWTFDTLGLPSFSLSKIMPGSSDVMIHVVENEMYSK